MFKAFSSGRIKGLIIPAALVIIIGIFHYEFKERPSKDDIDLFSRIFDTPGLLGETAPNFRLDLVDGEDFSLDEHIGKDVVVINFFSVWCRPCREEMPELNSFYSRNKENLVMLGIAFENDEGMVRDFIEELEVPFLVGMDADGAVAEKYRVDAFPTTVLIGPDGKIHFYETGAIYNVRVSLEPMYKTALLMLSSGHGLSREEYLAAERERWSAPPRVEAPSGLTQREEDIARRIHCPRGCGRNLIDCDCRLCKRAIKEIREEKAKGRTDDEIVKIINTRYCLEND